MALPGPGLLGTHDIQEASRLHEVDDRPGAPPGNVFWAGDQGQAGQVLHGYQSMWLPAALLQGERRQALCDALFAASRRSGGVLAPEQRPCRRARGGTWLPPEDTAMNPAVLDAFALVICGARPPAYPGVAATSPTWRWLDERAPAIQRAMDELRKVAPNAGSYLAESNFFEPNWQQSFWGANYSRLLSVKDRYDPEGLFFVHHGVGSERWSGDGFTRLPERH